MVTKPLNVVDTLIKSHWLLKLVDRLRNKKELQSVIYSTLVLKYSPFLGPIQSQQTKWVHLNTVGEATCQRFGPSVRFARGSFLSLSRDTSCNYDLKRRQKEYVKRSPELGEEGEELSVKRKWEMMNAFPEQELELKLKVRIKVRIVYS